MKIKFILFILISAISFSNGILEKPESMNISTQSGNIRIKTNELLEVKSYTTTGIGLLSGAPIYGKVLKNKLGFPKREFGLNNLLGFSYTWIFDTPKKEEVYEAVSSVYSKNNSYNLSDYQLNLKVKKELDQNVVNYFTLGSAIAIIPINVEYGWMFLSENSNIRTRIGVGLPTILSVGMSADF
ncbi:MAG: hypothetical protein ACQERZ_09480 [Fusobacteriota bacterium]